MEENKYKKQETDLKEMKRKINEFILEEINMKYRNNEEKVLEELLNAMGYETRILRKSDEEKDIIATKPKTSLSLLLQFKETSFDEIIDENKEEEKDRDVFKIDNNYDILVTLSNYGDSNNGYAKELKVNKALGGREIVELVLKYYPQMSNEFKEKIPLKNIYVPYGWDKEEINNVTLIP